MPVVVITGASQGIGKAIAGSFSTEPGVRLGLISRNREKLEAVASGCRAAGAEARTYPCDLTNDRAVHQAAEATIRELGVPEVLINNAGSFRPSTILETTPETFREQIETNLTSAFVVTRAFLPAMIEAGRGTIFFMASVASIRAYPSGVSYAVAKHGILGLARSLREEMKPYGIRVTSVIPGATRTASWDGVELPEERFIPPEDVADAILSVYHLSDRSVVEEILIRPQLGDI